MKQNFLNICTEVTPTRVIKNKSRVILKNSDPNTTHKVGVIKVCRYRRFLFLTSTVVMDVNASGKLLDNKFLKFIKVTGNWKLKTMLSSHQRIRYF